VDVGEASSGVAGGRVSLSTLGVALISGGLACSAMTIGSSVRGGVLWRNDWRSGSAGRDVSADGEEKSEDHLRRLVDCIDVLAASLGGAADARREDVCAGAGAGRAPPTTARVLASDDARGRCAWERTRRVRRLNVPGRAGWRVCGASASGLGA
jgi:hypothetical protein